MVGSVVARRESRMVAAVKVEVGLVAAVRAVGTVMGGTVGETEVVGRVAEK